MTKTILDHKGLLTFSSIDTLITEFKVVSQEHDIAFRSYKRILTVMIESLENVLKYTDAYQDFVEYHEEFEPTFRLILDPGTIELITTNPVKKEDVERLRQKIDNVNSKNRDELKALYLETITDGKFSEKGGAGLGFIEMAKTSGNPLKYSFEKISDAYSLYTFIVTFTR